MDCTNLQFESILNLLKTDVSDNTFLTITAKIEIFSLAAESITADKILSFAKLLPIHNYHFNFIKNHMVFYILNYSTLGFAKRFSIAETLCRELKIFHRTFQSTSKLQNLNNAEVLYQFEKLIESIQVFKAELASPIGKLLRQETMIYDKPTEKSVKYVIIQQNLIKINNLIQDCESIKNCRLIAELIDELYQKVYRWFMQIFTYDDIIFPNDNFLDRLLKMDFCYTYYTASNQHLLSLFEQTIDNQIFIDPSPYFEINPVYSPELQFMSTFSLKIFSKNISAKNEDLYIYPLLKTNFSILTFLSLENIFFHHGFIYHILHRTNITPTEEKKLGKINGFLNTVIQQVLIKKNNLQITFPELLDKIYHLHRIGLNIETAQIFLQMLTTYKPATTNNKLQTFFTNFSIIIFSAYIFFLCIELFSPTFIFHNKKKLILEKQKSIILILGEQFSFIWKEVSEIVDLLFSSTVTETYFKFYSKGADDYEKDFLYKDLMEKWGELFFPLTYSMTTPQKYTDKHVSNTVLKNLCDTAYQSKTETAYESLLPYITHPEFKFIFITHYVRPSLSLITNLTFEEIKDNRRLLILIFACKLLMPSNYLLSHYLLLLHAFTLQIFKVDLGHFSIIHAITQKIFDNINSLTQTIFIPKTNFLVSLLLTAYTVHMQTYVNPWIQKTISENIALLKEYIDFTKKCSSTLATTCYLNLENFAVNMYFGKNKVGSTSLSAFYRTCSKLIEESKLFKDRLQEIKVSKTLFIEMLQNVVKNITKFKDLVSNQTLQNFIIIVERISSHANTTYQDVLNSIDECHFSNMQLIQSFKNIVYVIDVLNTKNIFNFSLASQLIEAKKLVKKQDTYNQLNVQDDFVTVLKSHLNNLFEKQKPTINIERRFMLEGIPDIKQIPFLDVFDERYRLIPQIEKYLHWYIAYSEAAQADLVEPLLLKLG